MKNNRMKLVKPGNGNGLHGQRMEQIRKDLRNKELSDKEKVLRYSSHLDWFIQKVKGVFAWEQMLKQPNVWNRNEYSHGMLNSVISIIALFLEDQGKPPHFKRPEKYLIESDELLAAQSSEYIAQLEEMIARIIENPPDGDKGDEFNEWKKSVLSLVEDCYLQTDELVKIRRRMKQSD